MKTFVWILLFYFQIDYNFLKSKFTFHFQDNNILNEQLSYENISTAPCSLSLDPNSFYANQVPCWNDSLGSILFVYSSGIIGGTPPFTYDWDDLSTPDNDVFNDDGEIYIDSVPAGFYAIIVTDNVGCTATASVEVESPPNVFIATLIDSVRGCKLTGGIQIITILWPYGFLNFNWDYANTPYDDDFGTGTVDFGLPPEENDSEDILTGLKGGIYYLTITKRSDPSDPSDECFFVDTFNIWSQVERVFCPFSEISLFAGTSDPTKLYQWQVDSTNGFQNIIPDNHYSGSETPILTIANTPSSWYGYQYRCIIYGNMDSTMSEVFNLIFRVCWNGTGNLWNNNINRWNCNCLPDSETDVFIESNLGQYPLIDYFNAFCRSLTLKHVSTVHVGSHGYLNVTGGN